MDEGQLVEQLLRTPPTCLSAFNAAPSEVWESFDDSPQSAWRIRCQCGGEKGRLLGYTLSDYDTEYRGPVCFLSPLAFECVTCNAISELLDTDRHGYHAELSRLEGDGQGSSKLRGTGPRQTLGCPSCSSDTFRVKVGFVYWHPDELAEEFDEAWEDLFSVFLCQCICASCNHTFNPTDFGKL